MTSLKIGEELGKAGVPYRFGLSPCHWNVLPPSNLKPWTDEHVEKIEKVAASLNLILLDELVDYGQDKYFHTLQFVCKFHFCVLSLFNPKPDPFIEWSLRKCVGINFESEEEHALHLISKRERKPAPAMTELLAKEFSKILLADIGRENLEQAVKLNEADPDAIRGLICHTHDFCDANEVMLQAWKVAFLEEFLGEEQSIEDKDKECALTDEAWNVAKANRFYLN